MRGHKTTAHRGPKHPEKFLEEVKAAIAQLAEWRHDTQLAADKAYP